MSGGKNELAAQAERFAKWWVDQSQERARGETVNADTASGAAAGVPAAAVSAPQRAYEVLSTAKQQASKLIDEERARVTRQLTHAIVAAAKPMPVRAVRDEQALCGLFAEVIAAAKMRLAGAQLPAPTNGDGGRDAMIAKAADGLAEVVREEVDRHLQSKLEPLRQQLKVVIESVQREVGRRDASNAVSDSARKAKSARMPKLKLSRSRSASGSRRPDSGV
ncbi:MAG: hypothetical protein E6Q88_10710 [Lysobacteraceae bacterium]|nr:MAG: hypothetical protein E6Q88_10710 [Xanthomonadaceae bacterium]